ncbi:SET domain-containing protein [Pleomassaria siparia CBS 279.74]|uniref:SET domain-containing protein n=1 Tax=Pleomassaria siparia CBS 279.74 TaxID=1314801 RepID=A0A6G1JTS8_9PLEO|nr:SET domain-containing protein [Pleomassaria siparia CBS 279.74]
MGSFLSGTDSNKEIDIPIFEINDIPGKGRGLIARSNISKGTRILCERPLFTVPSMEPSLLELVLAARLKALPKASQRQFLSLHNRSPGKYPFSNIFNTNALPCGSGSVVGGVYPTICLINHSCIPNSHHNWDEDAEHETIYAIRPIRAGEEITITYHQESISAIRRAFLKESFGFDCSCSGCSRSPSELQESDARRLQIQKLDENIVNPSNLISRPNESLRDCRSLLQVMDVEYDVYAEALNARTYYDAFQVCIAHGDQARASVFADRAYKGYVICEGENSPEAQRVKSLGLKPAAHVSFELCSTKWKTTRGMVPKSLDSVQFEKWLFRE